jgi:hypothetical protein
LGANADGGGGVVVVATTATGITSVVVTVGTGAATDNHSSRCGGGGRVGRRRWCGLVVVGICRSNVGTRGHAVFGTRTRRARGGAVFATTANVAAVIVPARTKTATDQGRIRQRCPGQWRQWCRHDRGGYGRRRPGPRVIGGRRWCRSDVGVLANGRAALKAVPLRAMGRHGTATTTGVTAIVVTVRAGVTVDHRRHRGRRDGRRRPRRRIVIVIVVFVVGAARRRPVGGTKHLTAHGHAGHTRTGIATIVIPVRTSAAIDDGAIGAFGVGMDQGWSDRRARTGRRIANSAQAVGAVTIAVLEATVCRRRRRRRCCLLLSVSSFLPQGGSGRRAAAGTTTTSDVLAAADGGGSMV